MKPFWEFEAFAYIAGGIIVVGILCVVKAYFDDRRRWRSIKPHYGSCYDATSNWKPRPNVRSVPR